MLEEMTGFLPTPFLGAVDGLCLHLQLCWLPGPFCGFPGGSVVKSPPADAGDWRSIPGSERSPGGGRGYPLQ